MRSADHLYHMFIAAQTVTASQTLRSPGQPKRTKTEWGLTNSQTKPSKPMLQSNMMVDIQNRQSTQFTLWQQVPCAGSEGSKHATKIKTISSSIFNIQIHTDKLLSKNIFSTFFYFFTLLVHNPVVFSWCTMMIINCFRLNHFQVQNESLHRTFELIIAFVLSCICMCVSLCKSVCVCVCVFVSVSAQIEAVGPAC